MTWMTPITNWVKEQSIEYTDFNRIENNIQEARAYLVSIGYTVPTMTFVTNRTSDYVDDLESINRIEQNLETIRVAFVTPLGYPGAKAWNLKSRFSSDDANRLEIDVKLLYETAHGAYANFRYCGTQSCGGEWGLIY